jgi:hypothetical protein
VFPLVIQQIRLGRNLEIEKAVIHYRIAQASSGIMAQSKNSGTLKFLTAGTARLLCDGTYLYGEGEVKGKE